VPAQTGKQLHRALTVYGWNGGSKFRVASNPEFLRKGTAVGDFFHLESIVVGCKDAESDQQLREIYAPILKREFHCPVHQPKWPPGLVTAFLVTVATVAIVVYWSGESWYRSADMNEVQVCLCGARQASGSPSGATARLSWFCHISSERSRV
jgi:hypothetical protein